MAQDRPRLDTAIPEAGFSSPDDALDVFLEWVGDCGLSLYPHQEEAILELYGGQHVVLNTPTGSGKSLVALALHFQTFAACGRTVYTAPIKALVSEKFFDLCTVFGPEHVGLMTGDGAVNRDAPILCCTAEILANMALRQGDDAGFDSVVMDEFHYYADRDRGMAWQIPLLVLTGSRFLLMSATLGDTTQIRADITERTGTAAVEVRDAKRPVPLAFEYSTSAVHETIERLLSEDKAPIYLVHFTQRSAAEQAQALMSSKVCTKEEKKVLSKAVQGTRFDSPYGKTVRRYVMHGIGLHHAGLLPRYRMLVEQLAQRGLLKVICGTDTLGVGINVPIRSVLFTQLCKYDGVKVRILRTRDFQQIAGRAGRAGFDTVGFVVAQAPAHIIENRRRALKAAKQGRKKARTQSAPTRGYKHWDQETFKRLSTGEPERLESRFRVDHGRLLNLMQNAMETTGDARDGVTAMLDLIDRCHATANRKAELREETAALLEHLSNAEVVHTGADGTLSLTPGLQQDFSLHHSLSLFLVDALSALDPASETYALDVVSLTEAIMEQPRAVLLRQADKARDALHWELKNGGVPYEERIERLKEVSWPQPQADWIRAVFDTYAHAHPWVLGEDIHPKFIARDLLEQLACFSNYVQDLGLERSEGVLLRYLTHTYKTLLQNVPASRQDETLIEKLATLRAMLSRVDASLVAEWERLAAGEEADGGATPVLVDISQDRKRFHARIRAELHALLRALSMRDWAEAVASVDPGDELWSAEDFEEALAPFEQAFGSVRFDHRARLSEHTTIRSTGPLQWAVIQRLIDPEDEGAWSLDGTIDLRGDTNPSGPLIQMGRIGE
jgi:superfamily II RNA helicase